MTILCYPNCTTCKKAQAFLQERKMNVSVRNIKEQNPTYEELKEWQKKSNLPGCALKARAYNTEISITLAE